MRSREHRDTARVQAKVIQRGVREVRPETRPSRVDSAPGVGDEGPDVGGQQEFAASEHERVARHIGQQRRDICPVCATVSGLKTWPVPPPGIQCRE